MSELHDILTAETIGAARRPLERAATLPAQAYTSPVVWERERERIFEREWLCAGRADQIPEAGDYLCVDLLGERLVVVRDTSGEVRVLSRVCRHRGAEVISDRGNARAFRCPYHSWTYRLDGRLAGAPLMDGAHDFDPDRCRLPELRSEIWEGFVFVNFDPDAEPLSPRLASLSRALRHYGMSDAVTVETATYDSPFNWKILVDNFMEAYHHIAIHRDTLQATYPAAASSAPDNDGPYSLLDMPAKELPTVVDPDPAGALPPLGAVPADQAERLLAAAVFPSHLFALTPEMLTWYQILPDSQERFTLRIFSCVSRVAATDPQRRPALEAMQTLTRVIHEQDIEACEATWAGLQSRFFGAGRLSRLEKPIWQFNQWWLERMAD